MRKQPKKYRVEVTRAGRWWAIHFPEDDRIHSQARRLDQVPAMAADALSLSYDRSVSPDQVEIVAIHLGGSISSRKATRNEAKRGRGKREKAPSLKAVVDALDEYIAARRLRREVTERASRAMRRVAGEGVEHGLTVRDIGHLLDVTYQRAAVLAREARAHEDD
ncbi:MAG: hypothetical protein GEU99_02190 [Luteitalea sp.]|nr:hypothetical protein [Luteitalea sp.]